MSKTSLSLPFRTLCFIRHISPRNFLGFIMLTFLTACGSGSDGREGPVGGGGQNEPEEPKFTLEPRATKQFFFSWPDEGPEISYRLLEDPDGHSGYTLIATMPKGVTEYSHEVFLPQRVNARYILEACNNLDCSTSGTLAVSGTLTEAVGYLKPSNADEDLHWFGDAVSLSTDGTTLAVAAGDSWDSGAVYVYIRDGDDWIEEGYLEISNSGFHSFDRAVSLSGDGNTLTVSAIGAVLVFTRSAGDWAKQAHVEASNTNRDVFFGPSLSLSANGDTLAVGAYRDSSNATGIDGDQNDNSAEWSGAVYIFARNESDWTQQAYIKASNTNGNDRFGYSASLSANGDTLAVGAIGESSSSRRPGRQLS